MSNFQKRPMVMPKQSQLKAELFNFFKYSHFSLLRDISELVNVVPYIQGVPGGMDETSGECFLC